MRFLIDHPQYKYFRKVKLYEPFEDWSPETIGRELRRLESEGYLQASYYDGKYARNLVRYSLTEKGKRFFTDKIVKEYYENVHKNFV